MYPVLMTSNDDRGFTLLELVLSVTLMGIVILIVAGGLRLGIQARAKGTDNVTGIQSARVILDLVKRQISSALPYEIRKEGKTFSLFTGDSRQLQFVSTTALTPGSTNENVLVNYKVVEEDIGKLALMIFEKKLSLLDFNDDSWLDPTEKLKRLASNLEEISFEYSGSSDPEGLIIWETMWDGRERGAIPAAIRITITTREGEQAFERIVRLPTRRMLSTENPLNTKIPGNGIS